MNVRLTGILVVVLAALIGAYFWLGRAEEKARRAEEEKSRVVRVDSEKVVALRLERAGSQDSKVREISLIKQNGTWRVKTPLELRADDATVKDLLASLEDIKRSRVIDSSAKDLAAFGLQPAKVAVEYKLEGGTTGTLLFGADSPSGEGTYLAVKGAPAVYLLPSTIRGRFEKSLYEVRSKRLLRRPRGEIAELVFERDGKRYALHKQGKDVWELLEPVKAKGDLEAANRTLELFLSGKAQRFVSEEPSVAELARFGLDSPKVRITLAGEGGKDPDVFVIGKQDPESKDYFARREGTGPVFQLERFSVEDLPKSPLEARNRRIYEFEKEAVNKVELESPAGRVTIRKTGKDEWEVEGDGVKLPGNDRRISDMLWDIKYAKIAGFYDAPAQLPDPALADRTTRKVALYVEGREEPLRFTVGQPGPSDPTQKDKEDRERWFAKRADGSLPFLLTRDTVDRISKGVWDFQERKALKFEYQDAGRLRFLYTGGEAVELVKEGRRWRMLKPLDEIAVGDKVDFILNEIYFLEFEAVTKEGIPDFTRPDLTVEVSLKDGKQLPILRFVRNEKKKIAYVRRGDEPTTYEIEDRFLTNVPRGFRGFLSKE